MAPIGFGGDDVTGVTIGGDDVTEITHDGDVVWTADDGSGGGTDEVMLEDAESYSNDEEFFDVWGVPQAYVAPTTSNPLEGSQSILSDEAYADGTHLNSNTTDGHVYSCLMKHGTSDDAPAFIIHQQSDRDVADCIRCEVDGRDDHVDLWVFDGGSILDEQRNENFTVDTNRVHRFEIEVTSTDVTATIFQADTDFSSSWDYASATFTEFTSLTIPNNASYSGGYFGFYGGRGAGSKWDRFTETPIQ